MIQYTQESTESHVTAVQACVASNTGHAMQKHLTQSTDIWHVPISTGHETCALSNMQKRSLILHGWQRDDLAWMMGVQHKHTCSKGCQRYLRWYYINALQHLQLHARMERQGVVLLQLVHRVKSIFSSSQVVHELCRAGTWTPWPTPLRLHMLLLGCVTFGMYWHATRTSCNVRKLYGQLDALRLGRTNLPHV